MKDVITLNQESFSKACLELYRKVEDDGYQPDWVIGIASGGVKLLDELPLKNREKGLHCTCTLHLHTVPLNFTSTLHLHTATAYCI